VRSIKRGLDVVLHVLVPVSGAKDSRPLVDIVLAYLNDPKGLLGLISEAHMSWQILRSRQIYLLADANTTSRCWRHPWPWPCRACSA